jgi:hypothetical protein
MFGDRAARLRVALAVALGLALVTPPAAMAYEAVRRRSVSSRSAHLTGVPLAAPRPGGREAPLAQSAGPSVPAAGTSVDDRLTASVTDALAKQQAALLAGDAAGFLAPADPSNTALRGELSRRFGSLRAMGVAVWHESINGAPTQGADGSWTVPVQLTYCFVAPDCSRLQLSISTRWTNSSGLRMVAFGASSASDLGPRPWEASDLRAAAGPRVILATTARYASRLPSMLAEAEKAAAVTDRYAKWDRPPGRYVVLLAGPDEWGTWYGVKQQSWVAAFAMPLADDATEVVLNAARVDTRDTVDVLRHEFTHVVTLVGVSRSYEHSWWLVEGIAEYVRVTGGTRPFDGLAEVRKYVHSGRWPGDVALDEPPPDSSASDVNGRYGVAYLALRRLADRFGEDKLLAFFAAVARTGTPLAPASLAAFGVSWDTVAADCAQYVRSQTR